jgi:hypothetical protein
MAQTPIRLFKGSTETSHLDFVGEFDQYTSCSFGIAWYGVGQFTISCNKNITFNSTSTLGTELIEGRYVMLGNSERNVGKITRITEEFNAEGKSSERITISGEELKGMFSSRMVNIAATYNITDQAETCMKELVKDQCGADASANRQFEDFTIEADGSRGGNYTMSCRWTNLLDELDECSRASGIGYWIEYDVSAGNLVFICGEGTDRSAAQSVNPRAIFSNTWNSIGSGQYEYNESDYKNLAYVGGQGVQAGRTIRTVYDTSEPTGIARRETFIDARDLSATADLDARGAQKLDELQYTEFIDVTTLTASPVEYGTAYNVGDLCTISAFGGEFNTRIIGATIVIEPNRYEVELQFDKRAPSLPSIVAKGKAIDAYNASNIEIDKYIGLNTWNAILSGSVTPGTPTYTNNTGYYQKQGNFVTFHIDFNLSNLGGAVGNITITLPIAGTGLSAVNIGFINNFTPGADVITYAHQSGSVGIHFYTFNQSTGAVVRMIDTNFSNTTRMILSGTYRIT